MRLLPFFLLTLLPGVMPLSAQTFPHAYAAGEHPQDHRLGDLRTLNDDHPFHKVATREAWETRAASLRRQVLVATGLWPMPTKGDLNVVEHGTVTREDYTVSKVYFESFPGHYVSGSLYRPKSLKRGQKVPGILSPHGHWTHGRFHDHGEANVKKEIESGAERFASGRHPLQARCVQLARMGCVVFHYDMVGYADSVQLDHRQSSMAADGLFSTRAELRLQNMMGIQTFNSVRALDFIESLPEVDQDRIGVTGASGGGTQTFILGAIDDRPDLLFPAVMVSTGMQGGCVCENASYLRIGAGNVDLAALAVPRPLGLTGADDWTVEIETKGMPDLAHLYGMHGCEGQVEVFPYLQFGHNFNAVSREAMAGFVNKHFNLGHPEPVRERDFEPLSEDELSVWTETHPAPRGRGAAHEGALLKWWEHDSGTQIAAIEARLPNDAGARSAYEEVVGGAWDTLLGRRLGDVGEVIYTLTAKEEGSVGLRMTGTLRAEGHDEEVAALFLHPGDDWNREVVVWVHGEEGKSSVLTQEGDLAEGPLALVELGYAVAALDPHGVGEAAREGAVINDERFAGYTFGYNYPVFAKRVHDMLTTVGFIVTTPDWDVQQVHLAGMDALGGALVLAACGQIDDPKLGKAMAKLDGWRFDHVTSWKDDAFLPGAVKYGDVSALATRCGEQPLFVVDDKSGWETATTVNPALVIRETFDGEEVLRWLAD